MNLELDPVDYLPAFYLFNLCNRNSNMNSRQRRCCSATILSHLLVMLLTFALCTGGYYYYYYYYNNGSIMDSDDYLDIDEITPDIIDKDNRAIMELMAEIDRLKQVMEQKADTEYVKYALKKEEAHIEKKIIDAIDIYDSDKIGLYDYAATYAGGMVCSTPDTFPYSTNTTITLLHFFHVDLYSSPEVILQPSTLPGHCFAFTGSVGRIRIKLGEKIRVQSVTMDHPISEFLEDYRSAPKEFEVYALSTEMENNGNLLGKFVYDIKGRPYQTFNVTDTGSDCEYLELKIVSNYGNLDYTCLYRFRVHNRQEP